MELNILITVTVASLPCCSRQLVSSLAPPTYFSRFYNHNEEIWLSTFSSCHFGTFFRCKNIIVAWVEEIIFLDLSEVKIFNSYDSILVS
mmetsp:Transcript_44198/g.71016  ORF Transcript_44198/g.71016 Transcript_44198/m.71016 type:complete len:89 (-) Transcript_44198:962-1228(-)